MEPHKAARKITEEIIGYFNLPRKMCYGPINTWIHMAIGIGFDLGRDTTTRSKPVAKLDNNGRVHTVYPSMAAAARDHDVALQNISSAIKHKRRSGGSYWKLVDPNDHYIYRKK